MPRRSTISQGRRATEPVLPPDAMSPSDTVLGHDEASAAPYREAAERARRSGPGRVYPGREPAQAEPAEALLPLPGVAAATVQRELARLRDQAAALERDTARPAFGAQGQVVAHLVERQAQARESLRQVQARIDEIEHFNEDEVRRFAHELGAR